MKSGIRSSTLVLSVAAIGPAQASQWLPALLSRMTGETSQQPAVIAAPARNGPAAKCPRSRPRTLQGSAG